MPDKLDYQPFLNILLKIKNSVPVAFINWSMSTSLVVNFLNIPRYFSLKSESFLKSNFLSSRLSCLNSSLPLVYSFVNNSTFEYKFYIFISPLVNKNFID